MSERYWPGPALAATTLSLLATAITGCGNTARTGPASATKVAGVAGVAADTGRDSNAYPGPNAYAGSST